jgi:hypothetical protein
MSKSGKQEQNSSIPRTDALGWLHEECTLTVHTSNKSRHNYTRSVYVQMFSMLSNTLDLADMVHCCTVCTGLQPIQVCHSLKYYRDDPLIH